MVTTRLLAASEACVWQARTALPSRWTVHAPHRPAPQPYLVPVNPTWSRMTHKSGVPGAASTDTCLSFSVNEIIYPPCADVSLDLHGPAFSGRGKSDGALLS